MKYNPDLPDQFIKDAQEAKAQMDSGDVTPFIFKDAE